MTLPPLPFEGKPVRRMSCLNADELMPHAFEEPLVLTGCMDDWKLFQEMRARKSADAKLSFLGSLLGQAPVSFHRLPRESRGQFHYAEDTLERLTFGESTGVRGVPFDVFAGQLLKTLRGEWDDYVYMQGLRFDMGTPLFDALGPNLLPCLSKDQVFTTLWAGCNGTVTNLHYDDFLTFICMVEGRKRVVMFSPEELPNVHVAPFDRLIEHAQVSMMRLLEPDLKRYPRYARAFPEARVVVLEPGEVLLVPPMWWHHVESVGFNVMVNNRVFLATFEDVVDTYANISQGVRLFFDRPAQELARARELYQRTVFGPGATASEPVPEANEPPAYAQHRADTRRLAARIPEFLSKHLARYYEHFVFQANGDPFSSMPGELAAMVARNAHAKTLFPRDD
jgi:cupin-like protein